MYVGLIASILWYLLDIWFIYEILICMWMMRSCLLLWKRCRGPPAGSLCTLYNLKNLHIFPHSLMILIFKYFLVDRFGEQVLFNDWFLFRPSLRLNWSSINSGWWLWINYYLILTTLQSQASVFFTALLPWQGQVYVLAGPTLLLVTSRKPGVWLVHVPRAACGAGLDDRTSSADEILRQILAPLPVLSHISHACVYCRLDWEQRKSVNQRRGTSAYQWGEGGHLGKQVLRGRVRKEEVLRRREGKAQQTWMWSLSG